MSASPDWSWTWLVSDELAGRADRSIALALQQGLGHWNREGDPPRISRSQIQSLMERSQITVRGSALRASSRLKPGEVVQLSVPEPRPLELVPEERPLEILFEDEHLAVINKPPGLTVHPSETQAEGTLVHALLHHMRDLSGIGGVLRPGIVHRIDKNTSGAILVTKTDLAHSKMADAFSRREIGRRYWALVYGAPKTGGPDEWRTIESLIGRNPQDRKKMSMQVKTGRRAVTRIRLLEAYRVQEKHAFAAWVEAELETGRTHQVRVHLTGIHHSILGDPVYGVPTERAAKWLALPRSVRLAVHELPGQALHARTLEFTHPFTAKRIRIEADPPPAFKGLHRVLQEYR